MFGRDRIHFRPRPFADTSARWFVNATEENFRSQCATADRSSRIHSGSRTTAVGAKRTFARPAMSPKCQITDVLRSVSTTPDQRFLSKGEECELEVRVVREPAVV